jgi:hypothetical protein
VYVRSNSKIANADISFSEPMLNNVFMAMKKEQRILAHSNTTMYLPKPWGHYNCPLCYYYYYPYEEGR